MKHTERGTWTDAMSPLRARNLESARSVRTSPMHVSIDQYFGCRTAPTCTRTTVPVHQLTTANSTFSVIRHDTARMLQYRKVPNSNNLWVWINRSILGGFGRGLVWINRYIRTGGMVVCTGTTRSVVRTVRIVRTVRTTIRTAYRTYCTYCTYCTYQL